MRNSIRWSIPTIQPSTLYYILLLGDYNTCICELSRINDQSATSYTLHGACPRHRIFTNALKCVSRIKTCIEVVTRPSSPGSLYGKSSVRVAAFIAKSVMSHSAVTDPLPSTRRRRVVTSKNADDWSITESACKCDWGEKKKNKNKNKSHVK